ncbi:hypothetical protein HanLR1_Chr08g0272061 [Helianthus annuus]|nr:hypothetical protein HanHA89_Chr08g0290201 [Helianthus annuus]KAJ0718569.1 hypothetical protein HanLR1_Chr08g0272061 [Helianthus annuus]
MRIKNIEDGKNLNSALIGRLLQLDCFISLISLCCLRSLFLSSSLISVRLLRWCSLINNQWSYGLERDDTQVRWAKAEGGR